MTIPKLTIIPAGAGSGKTYKLQKQLYQWIKDGLVRPDRIVAVTFTEAAASELRTRVRTELVDNGRLQDALKLEKSYISTIHGFGLRLMTEFAFEAGVSPQPRMLNEDEESAFTRLILSSTDEADTIVNNLKDYGYTYDFMSKKGAEEIFRERILNLINTLRSIGIQQKDPQLVKAALQQIKNLYGPTRPAEILRKTLGDAIQQLLNQFPDSLTRTLTGLNQTASKDFRGDHYNLKRAISSNSLDTDWGLWQKLRGLRQSKKGTPTPEGYDDLALEVIDAANALPEHPGPLQDALAHVEALLETSQEILSYYASLKLDKGLVDFTDMLAISRKLLATNTAVLEEVRNRVDCLVIDEFQDTNPLQFSLLWTLFEAGIPALIVGDLKQAIMRFQNADSRLMESLVDAFSDNVEPLTSNWRSSKELMAVVNQISRGLFKERYEYLAPKADFKSQVGPIDGVLLEKGSGKSDAQKARHMALHIQHILENKGLQIWDKRRKKQRPLKAYDIAILCFNHNHLSHYANALNQLGLKTQIASDGWFQSRSVQLLYYILSYLADPADKHAALYLAVTELGSYSLEDAVTELLDGQDLAEKILDKLSGEAQRASSFEIPDIINLVIELLDLYTLISKWPDANQARANIIRFQGEATEFLSANKEALESGGYYAGDLKTFLTWLRAKAELDNSLPNARIVDEDAINLVTWHSSKGREWPVVAVCRLDKKWYPRLPNTEVVYDNFDQLGDILDTAHVEFFPKFVARESNQVLLDHLTPMSEQDALNILYVALTRAREKLIIECPVFQKQDAPSYWNLLRERTSLDVSNAQKISIMETSFTWSTRSADCVLEDDFAEARKEETDNLPNFGRRAITPFSPVVDVIPERIIPSSLHGESEQQDLLWKHQKYTEPLTIKIEGSPLERGTIIHRYIELLVGGQTETEKLKSGVNANLDLEQSEAIVRHAQSFLSYLDSTIKPITVQTEVPILYSNNLGSVVTGNIDLLVESNDAYWIVDHKSDRTDDLESSARSYSSQLACYQNAVQKSQADKPVAGMIINWVSAGMVSVCQI